MRTVLPRTRRLAIFGAVLALIFSLGFFAAPAQAQASLTFTVDQPSIELGQAFTLSWTAADTTEVVASGAWTGNKSEVGTETITPTATGSLTYTLEARDFNGRDVQKSVSVEVTPAALPEVTPAPVLFGELCRVYVPETEGVIYSITLDGHTEVIESGYYDGADFAGDSAAIFTAAADDQHVLAADAVTTWEYTPGEDCVSEPGGDVVVTVTASCSAVTFTNVTDAPAEIQYGSFDEDDADGQFVLAAGASRKIATSRPKVDFMVMSEGQLRQIDSISVRQDCGDKVDDVEPKVPWKSKHPTAAPAAGVAGEGDAPTGAFLVLMGAVTLIVARRAYSLSR